MQRRDFISSVIGGVAASGLSGAAAHHGRQSRRRAAGGAPEFYAWQHYVLRNGTQQQRMAEFLQNAADPCVEPARTSADRRLRSRGRRDHAFDLPARADALARRAGVDGGEPGEGHRVPEGGRDLHRRPGRGSRLRAARDLSVRRVPQGAAHPASRADRREASAAVRAAHLREPFGEGAPRQGRRCSKSLARWTSSGEWV